MYLYTNENMQYSMQNGNSLQSQYFPHTEIGMPWQNISVFGGKVVLTVENPLQDLVRLQAESTYDKHNCPTECDTDLFPVNEKF